MFVISAVSNLMISHSKIAFTSSESLKLSEFQSLRSFQSALWCGSEDSEQTTLVPFIGWLTEQLESLPPSHTFGLVILDHSLIRAKDLNVWHRLDEIICTRKTVRVSFTVANRECRLVLSSAFQSSAQAGLVSFTLVVS